jgi:Phosphodiester glycosidase
VFGAFAHAAAPRCKHTRIDALTWSRCAGDTVWIIETTRPLASWVIEGAVPTLRQHASASAEYSLMFNAGYHDGNYANAKLEGLHRFNGIVANAIKRDDPQLTHVLTINRAGRIASIRAAKAERALDDSLNATAIQSGPLILDQGRIARNFIRKSLNGSDAYKRTALGVTRRGETVIVIATAPYTLFELANIVLRINGYARRGLTLLNFDGGPSTAIHSVEIHELTYGADKVTPVAFGLRK